ncbi:MAG: SulP family inorganic anion transporter, partial [Gaiella sp.]
MSDLARRLAAGVPALTWLPQWRVGLRANVLAGLAVWAVLVPQSMGYAALAGLPPVHGLYAATAALVAYALLGTSGQLNVGPSSGIAVLSAATVAPLAAGDTDRAIVLSAVLALLTGIVLVVAGVARLGVVAEFFARPVLAGYVIGLGLVIVLGQVPALLGISVESDGFFREAAEIVQELPDLDPATAAIGIGSLALVLILGAVVPRAPAALVAVVAGIAAARALDLGAEGVALLGPTSAALPDLGLPELRSGDLELLLGGALGVALLALTESIAAARRYAALHGTEIDPNRELVANGAANIASSAVQGFAVDASMSRTALADASGQRTQLAGLLNAALVVLTLVFLTGVFADLPRATLAAVVIAAVLPLLRTGELRRIQRLDEVDFAFAALCLVGVLAFGPLQGIVIAVIASLVALVVRTFRPHTAVLGRR